MFKVEGKYNMALRFVGRTQNRHIALPRLLLAPEHCTASLKLCQSPRYGTLSLVPWHDKCVSSIDPGL